MKRDLNFKIVKLDGIDTEVKYLGPALDNKLIWNKHVMEVVNKATKPLMVKMEKAKEELTDIQKKNINFN